MWLSQDAEGVQPGAAGTEFSRELGEPCAAPMALLIPFPAFRLLLGQGRWV